MKSPGKALLPLLIIMLVLVGGCANGQASRPSATVSELESETVEIVQAASPMQEEALRSSDLPVDIGTELRFFANNPGTAVAVDFNLDGPWSFTRGGVGTILTITTIDAAGAPQIGNFPEADAVSLLSWTPDSEAGNATGAVNASQYSFAALADDALVSYGRFGPDERLRSYSSAVKTLVFPLTVGTSWTESYSEIEDGATLPVTAENTVLAFNQLRVPAGEFDAFLLQSRVTAGSGADAVVTWDYLWLVPGIGRAAEIISFPGEEEEQFDSARFFYRLNDFRLP